MSELNVGAFVFKRIKENGIALMQDEKIYVYDLIKNIQDPKKNNLVRFVYMPVERMQLLRKLVSESMSEIDSTYEHDNKSMEDDE